MSFEDFMETFLANDIAVLSITEVGADGSGLTPLVFDKEGTEMVAIFTSLDRARTYSGSAQFALTINAREFLKRLPEGFGVVLNPGYTEGLDIDPEGVGRILASF